MSLRNPRASVAISAEILPAPATEPNIGKSVELAVSLNPSMAGMTIAYCITLTCAALATGSAKSTLDLTDGTINSVTGNITAVRSGKDVFGNDLPAGQSDIGLVLIEAGATNNEFVKVEAAAAAATFKEANVYAGKFALADYELAGGNSYDFTFSEVGDSVKITVFSKTV